jgi:hypothetical protein
VVRSLSNPNGFLGGLARKLLSRPAPDRNRKAVETDYTVIDEKPGTDIKQEKRKHA